MREFNKEHLFQTPSDYDQLVEDIILLCIMKEYESEVQCAVCNVKTLCKDKHS